MIQRSAHAVEASLNGDQSLEHEVSTTRIIPTKSTTHSDWQTILSESNWQTHELLHHLELKDHPLASESAEALFPLKVPAPYLSKIEKGKAEDPLLLQILPQLAEHVEQIGYSQDPLQESSSTPVPGLIDKYRSRTLLITTQSCAINCRYCFRRNFPYAEHRLSRADWLANLSHIREDTQVNEVILSGGDPFTLNNAYLSFLVDEINTIEHIKRIRFHSRVVSTLPQRVDAGLLTLIEQSRCQVIVVLHINHPNEIGRDTLDACEQLKQAGATLLNQSVLLKNINDDPNILSQLSEKLFDIGVLPYYLFLLDKAEGTAHFEVSDEQACQIHRQLQSLLPGFLIPRLAREIPGRPSKTLIQP